MRSEILNLISALSFIGLCISVSVVVDFRRAIDRIRHKLK